MWHLRSLECLAATWTDASEVKYLQNKRRNMKEQLSPLPLPITTPSMGAGWSNYQVGTVPIDTVHKYVRTHMYVHTYMGAIQCRYVCVHVETVNK